MSTPRPPIPISPSPTAVKAKQRTGGIRGPSGCIRISRYWSSADPGSSNVSELNAKSAYIEGAHSVLDPNPMPPGLYQYSVVVSTPQLQAEEEQKSARRLDKKHRFFLTSLTQQSRDLSFVDCQIHSKAGSEGGCHNDHFRLPSNLSPAYECEIRAFIPALRPPVPIEREDLHHYDPPFFYSHLSSTSEVDDQPMSLENHRHHILDTCASWQVYSNNYIYFPLSPLVDPESNTVVH